MPNALRHRLLLGGVLVVAADGGGCDLLAVLEPAELDRLGDLLALADDDDVDLLADRHRGDELGQIARFLDVLAVELDDHVARHQAGGLGRAAIVDAGDQRAARGAEAEAFGDRIVDILDAHAEPAAPRLVKFLQAAR